MRSIQMGSVVALVATLGTAACTVDGSAHDSVDETMLHELAASPPALVSRAELDAAFTSVDNDEVLGVDKIRNGADIDFDDGFGRGVVLLPNGCTAQVINRWFLLTAGHCMAGILPFGVGDLVVQFTQSSGPAVTVYAGTALGWAQEGWELNFKDAAMILLVDGMDTCDGDLIDCEGTQLPNNAVFQWFRAGGPQFLFPQYTIAGYGTTDDANGFGTLRMATMSRADSLFNGDNTGLAHVLTWSDPLQPRPCKGDSGGPLVTPMLRLLHTGIASGEDSCLPDAGLVTYSGLTEAQLIFVATFLIDMRSNFGLPFDCGLGFDDANGLGVLHCDNDGTLH